MNSPIYQISADTIKWLRIVKSLLIAFFVALGLSQSFAVDLNGLESDWSYVAKQYLRGLPASAYQNQEQVLQFALVNNYNIIGGADWTDSYAPTDIDPDSI